MERRNKMLQHARANPTRVALLLLLAALVGLVVACANLSANTTREAVEAEVRRSVQTAAEQACDNLDYRLQQTADSVRTLLGTVYPYLNSKADLEGQISEYSEMNRIFAGYAGKYMISKLRLYAPADKIYSRQGDTFFSLDALSGDDTFHALLGGQKGGVFWQETHPVTDLGQNARFEAISCLGVVVGRSDYDQIVGALFMDISIDQLRPLLAAGENMEMCLVDGAGTILAHPDEAQIGQPSALSGRMDGLGRSGCVSLSDAIVGYARLESCEWALVNRVQKSRVYGADNGQLQLLRLLWGVTLLVAACVAMVVMYNLVLARTMKTIQAAVDSLDSAGEGAARGAPGLTANANRLAETARRVTEERYRNRLAVSEYQMKALQAQIKPHFLYNTLDVIKWMIVGRDYENGAWMVNALSRYLRLSINKGPDIVPLREEMELTRAYLGIMQRRFRGAFQVAYEIEEEALDCLLPKLSLQPLTENALIHGLLYCDKPDRLLTLRVWLEGDAVCIEIEDNGNGMSDETRDALLSQGPDDGGGYGVANVRERLRLFGGGESKFQIASRVGTGVCVTITLPVRTAESQG